MLNTIDILTYWRQVLEEAPYPLLNMGSPACGLCGNDLRTATLPAGCRLEKNTSYVVGFMPVYYQSTKNAKAQHHALVYLPAKTDDDGNLQPATDVAPWIPRDFLEPFAADRKPVLGQFDDFVATQTEMMFDNTAGWPDYIEKAAAMLEKVSGLDLKDIRLPQHWYEHRDYDALVCTADITGGMADNILNLYDDLIDSKETGPLLKLAIQGATPQIVTPLATDLQNNTLPPAVVTQMQRHSGQMNNRFGLGLSQRQAVQETLTLPDDRILAVQGPPGTGKTTLLQSVIASLWVNAALETDAMPPIIVGVSTNNKAVQNILNGFANAETPDYPLWSQRWLPAPLREYGLYFNYPRDSYHTALRTHGSRDKPWDGLPEQIETTDYLDKAKDFYTAKARDYLADPTLTDIAAIVKALHTRLTAQKQQLDRAIAALPTLRSKTDHDQILRGLDTTCALSADHMALQEQWATLAKAWKEETQRQRPLLRWLEPKNPVLAFLLRWPPLRRYVLRWAVRRYNAGTATPVANGDTVLTDLKKRRAAIIAKLEPIQKRLGAGLLQNITDLLDRETRYHLFHLAARYWEGRWLLEMDRVLNGEKPEPLGGQGLDVVRRRFQRWAMLMPCFISTLHRLPSVFRYYDGDNRHLKNYIDLLVVDEAGQIAPEIGAPAFALAKKALVVGDEYQIKPVFNTDAITDRKRLHTFGVDHDDLALTPLMSSLGNIMGLASRATTVSLPDMGDKPALFLEEHRRCPDAVIAFCNELVYHGKLRPLSGDRPHAPLPPWNYVHINATPENVSNSWRNPQEAAAIADWVARHAPDWKRTYNKPLCDILAVLTPYSLQKHALHKALRAVLPPDDMVKLTIGTVHALQGAEKPIVLFSATAGFGQTPFFDREPNMLNVAVSRAQDSFVVFGDMRLFEINPNSTSPSSILAKYLRASPETELADVSPGRRPDLQPFPVRRLVTHEEHEKLLLDGLNDARESVLIVSPYLSIHRLDTALCQALQDAVARQVHVAIVTCPGMNHENGPDTPLRKNFVLARDRLRALGCDIIETGKIHNKTLAIDLTLLNDGSYNWLSAVSDQTSDFHNRETSWVCHDPAIAEQIEAEWRDFGIDRLRIIAS